MKQWHKNLARLPAAGYFGSLENNTTSQMDKVMCETKEKVFELIKSTVSCDGQRKQWFGPEIAELGFKHHGLDDIPLDSILIIATLHVNGTLDSQEIIVNTNLDSSRIDDYIDALENYNLIFENPSSGKFQLTEKGAAACHDIFKNYVIRSRLELRRDLESIESLYLKVNKS